MRVGLNPHRFDNSPTLPPMLAVVVTHYEGKHAYHRERMPIVKACIESVARANIPLMVWDNGSDDRMRGWLVERKPNYLIFSKNIGKPNARTAVYGMLPPETLVFFTDDDMLHYPGWLEAHLEIIRAFPKIGAVSGWPIRNSFGWGVDFTLKWAKQNAKLPTHKGPPS